MKKVRWERSEGEKQNLRVKENRRKTLIPLIENGVEKKDGAGKNTQKNRILVVKGKSLAKKQ